MPKFFDHYIDRFTGWFFDATGGRVNLNSLLTGGSIATQLKTENGIIGVQNPLPGDMHSIFSKDINVSGSDIGTFSGTITDLVDDLDTSLTDDSATNPKYFEIKLNRPIDNTSIKFCSPPGSDFSNVKITLKDRSGITLVTVDETADDAKYSSNEYNWQLTAWCTIRVEFHTADAVAISWLIAEKTLQVHTINKFIDAGNSRSTPLEGGQTFTGDWVRTLDYSMALISVKTDEDAAADGLAIELSNDGSTVIHTHTFDVLANTPNGHHYPSPLDTKYYRIKYTAASAPTTLVIASTLFTVMVEDAHAHSIEYQIDASHPAPIRRAVLVGKKPNNDYTNFEATTGGNFKMSLEEYDDSVTPFRKDLEGGGKISVGTTAVEATFTGLTRSIIISADIANSGILYIGKSDVTNAGANAICFLQAGESATIDYDDSSNAVYVVASVASQNFWKGALL
jgi:hypothetical protein